MNDHAVLLIVLGACVCGALVAVGCIEYLVWLSRQQEGGRG